MRYGILSDTHANIDALEAVFKAYKSEGIDQFICLGDTVGYGARPNEACNLVRERVTQAVLGNHDAAVAGRMDYSYYYYAARQVLDKHAQLLDSKNMEWLKSLPYDYRADGILFCHGSPINMSEFEYIFARDQAAQCLNIWDDLPQLTLIGHSHLCKAFAIHTDYPGAQEVISLKFDLRPGWKYIVSVGSVGQPRDFDPRASYTIFDTDTKTFEFKRVDYDVKAAAAKILASDIEPSFATRLFLGI